MSKISTAIYFLKHPKWYSDLVRRLFLNIRNISSSSIENTQEEATAWAKEHCVEVGLVLAKFHGEELRLKDEFLDDVKRAEELENISGSQKGWGASGDFLYSLSEALQATRVVETGVAHGYSSLAMLLSLQKRRGILKSVDMPDPDLSSFDMVGRAVPERLKASWELVLAPDFVGLPSILRSEANLDLCHYDSDKTAEGRRFAYPLLWKSLRKGGLLVSDDIADNIAFKEFSESVNQKPIVVSTTGSGQGGARYVGILIKTDC